MVTENFGVGVTMLIQQDEIRNQIQEDYVADQLTLFEEYDPFTGEKR